PAMGLPGCATAHPTYGEPNTYIEGHYDFHHSSPLGARTLDVDHGGKAGRRQMFPVVRPFRSLSSSTRRGELVEVRDTAVELDDEHLTPGRHPACIFAPIFYWRRNCC